METKYCGGCNTLKNITEFGKDRTHSDGLRSVCKECISLYMKSYSSTNKEEISKRRKERYKINQEQEKQKNKERRQKRGAIWNENRRKKSKEDPRIEMFNAAKRRAKDKNLDFDIELDDILIPEKCPIFNEPLMKSEKKCSLKSPSIDRIDNTKGYIKGNIIVVSFRANTIKNNATIEELEQLIKFYKGLKDG